MDNAASVIWVFFANLLRGSTLQTQTGLAEHGDIAMCNVTLNTTAFQDGAHGPTSLRLMDLSPDMLGQPLRCYYSFQAVEGQRISIHIDELRSGIYDHRLNTCVNGYLRIWDGWHQPGRHRYPPNTFCGNYDNGHIDVNMFSSGTLAEMEFYAERAHMRTSFLVTYKYVNIAYEADDYPKQIKHHMNLVPSAASVCYWRIMVEDCDQDCPIVSPGYPGTYPPNIQCYYHVTSQNPNVAFQLTMTGHSRKKLEFDIPTTTLECRNAYLDVYDGDSTDNEDIKIGRFCGKEIPDITSSGNNLFLLFVSNQNEPPFGPSGFHLAVFGITKEWHQDATRIPDTVCDWNFRMTEGSISSPDHWLPKRTTCTYTINISRGHYLEVMINVYGLEAGCKEQIIVYERNQPLARLCENSLRDFQDALVFNITGRYGKVQYSTQGGQMQAHPDRGFWLSFRQIQKPEPENFKRDKNENAQPVIRTGVDGSSFGSSSYVSYKHHALLAFVVPCTVLFILPILDISLVL